MTSLLFARRLNVLCYHGFSYSDEHEFRPSLFMTAHTLDRRLGWLREHGFEAISLDAAVERLDNGADCSRHVVVTIDDGFRSTIDIAAPVFERHGISPTLYLTTYYVDKQSPIVNLVVQYLVWRRGLPIVLSACAGANLPDDLASTEQIVTALEAMTFSDRLVSLATLCEGSDLDYAEIERSGRFSLLSSSQVRELSQRGFDVQLHTHRHRWAATSEEVLDDLQTNREVIRRLTGTDPKHFCYPSGRHTPTQVPTLTSLGIVTATTCETGMNKGSAHRYFLSRFLDRDDFDHLEFEAEMYGFKEMLRGVRGSLNLRSRESVVPVTR